MGNEAGSGLLRERCGEEQNTHADGFKCLFQPTEFVPAKPTMYRGDGYDSPDSDWLCRFCEHQHIWDFSTRVMAQCENCKRYQWIH